MSTILLSTIAGERLASSKETVHQRYTETLPQLKHTGTCRNLFGPVDHDELKRELTYKLSEISRRDQLRWNFNFSEGQPLNGDLKWEESPAEDCPEFYREKKIVSKRPFVDFPTTEKIAHASKCGSRSMKVLKKTAMCNVNRRKSSRKTVARVQTKRLTELRITDFYGKRKKTDSVHKESRNME
ncbi:cyclin-dependent kinase inhibitor 1C [Siphateles boraxobius]|uniref:cyclin-dependent kinase inhibitor 1C n=1 Tax=Siphateles boraxobius TaxID=180520 RepID=UPI00406330A9